MRYTSYEGGFSFNHRKVVSYPGRYVKSQPEGWLPADLYSIFVFPEPSQPASVVSVG